MYEFELEYNQGSPMGKYSISNDKKKTSFMTLKVESLMGKTAGKNTTAISSFKKF